MKKVWAWLILFVAVCGCVVGTYLLVISGDIFYPYQRRPLASSFGWLALVGGALLFIQAVCYLKTKKIKQTARLSRIFEKQHEFLRLERRRRVKEGLLWAVSLGGFGCLLVAILLNWYPPDWYLIASFVLLAGPWVLNKTIWP